MSASTRNIVSFLGLVVLLSFLLYIRFPDFFVTPNRVIEPYADGFKSYTTIEYHAKYDTTYSFYSGMQYPYKEHVIPAAAQPLLSNLIRFVHHNIYPVGNNTNAIVNFSLLLSILLSGIFLYLIFLKLKLPTLYAIGVSIGMVFLAPQFERLVGHYGLAHMEVIPCLIYFLMRYDERRSIRRSLAVMLVVLAFSMIHFYFFAMQVFLITGYFFFKFLTEKKQRNPFFKSLWHYGIQVLVPLVLFLLWMKMGETATDRTSSPYGFLVYMAQPQGIFYSQFQPYFDYLKVSKWGMENRSYIGLFALLGSILMLLRYLLGLFRRPFIKWGTLYDGFFSILFLTAVLILLFSFGVPFVWGDMNTFLDYMGPIRQFRSIGRFAWVFYYVANIITITSFYYFFVGRKKSTKWRLAWLIIPIAVLNFEAYHQFWKLDLRLDPIGSARKGHTYLDVPNVNYDDYQAIISLPNFSIGSDNFWRHPDGAVAQESQVLSIQTGLPLTSAMLTRTSLSNTIKGLQLVSEPYRYPQLLDELTDDRPFIIVTSKIGLEKMAKKGFNYDHLLADAEFLFEKNVNADVLRLPFDSFRKRVVAKRNLIQEKLLTKDSLFHQGAFWVTDTTGFFHYDAFDDEAGEAYHGSGGYLGGITEDIRIFEQPIPQGDYFFTSWFYFQRDLYPRTVVTIEVKNSAGQVISSHTKSVADIVQPFDNNGWGMLSMPFSVPENGATTSIRFFNNQSLLKDQLIGLDEVLIYPQNEHIYFEDEAWMMRDNRWFFK